MEQADEIHKDEYEEWRGSRVTKKFLKDLFNKREALKEGIVELSQSTEIERFVAIGRTQALKDAIDWALFEFDYIGKYQEDDLETSSS